MSFHDEPTDSQGMTLRRPFAWLIVLGMGCSLTGLYRVLDDAPLVQAVTPVPRASADSTASSAAPTVSLTTVTQAPPADSGPATAEMAVAAVAATPTATPTAGMVSDTSSSAVSQPVEVLPAQLAGPAAPGVASPQKAASLLDLMNNARTKAGTAVLVRDSALDDVALTRAQNLIEIGYFDHYAPDGESAFSELASRGIRYRLAGENLARNNYADAKTVDAAFEGLMASAGHRANILEERFSRAGVAAVQSGKMWVYVTVFKD
jgi:uncharacterized protein YkwD